jgi:hypothetical protein
VYTYILRHLVLTTLNLVSNEEYDTSEHVFTKLEKNNMIRQASFTHSEANSLGSKAIQKAIEDEYDIPQTATKEVVVEEVTQVIEHTFGKNQDDLESENESTVKYKDLQDTDDYKAVPINYKEILNPEEGMVKGF